MRELAQYFMTFFRLFHENLFTANNNNPPHQSKKTETSQIHHILLYNILYIKHQKIIPYPTHIFLSLPLVHCTPPDKSRNAHCHEHLETHPPEYPTLCNKNIRIRGIYSTTKSDPHHHHQRFLGIRENYPPPTPPKQQRGSQNCSDCE